MGLQVDMNHSVIGFEPLEANRNLILHNFAERGLLESVRLLDAQKKTCTRFHGAGRLEKSGCICHGGRTCATLVNSGLSAIDRDIMMSAAGPFSSVTMRTYGGKVFSADQGQGSLAHFRVGAPLLEWWSRKTLGRSCLEIHLLKVDAEGSEFNVLRGLEPLLAEHRIHFIFLEFWPMAIMTWGTDPVGMLQWLAYYGFQCRFLGAQNHPQTFRDFVARHTTDETMSDFFIANMSFDDLLCEDIHWNEPCTNGKQSESYKW